MRGEHRKRACQQHTLLHAAFAVPLLHGTLQDTAGMHHCSDEAQRSLNTKGESFNYLLYFMVRQFSC